ESLRKDLGDEAPVVLAAGERAPLLRLPAARLEAQELVAPAGQVAVRREPNRGHGTVPGELRLPAAQVVLHVRVEALARIAVAMQERARVGVGHQPGQSGGAGGFRERRIEGA